MLILGIDTSCDDTSVAVVRNGTEVLSNIVSSQNVIHEKYGGIVPELACRKHLEIINFVTEKALKDAKVKFRDLDSIAVTRGPGLVGALLIGMMTAKSLAYVYNLPLIGINHLEAHIYANFLEFSSLRPPFVSLVISGGHTDLIYFHDFEQYKILGRTRDDAVGEAFDKVAKFLNLGYPGGPVIDRLSPQGDAGKIRFPRPFLGKSFDFSFSGLKTAVVNYVSSQKGNYSVADIAACFQQSVIEVLAKKAINAAKEMKVGKIVLGGGVSANSALRKYLKAEAAKNRIKTYFPGISLCTYNAAMIACLGYYKMKKYYKNKKDRCFSLSQLDLNVEPNLKIEENFSLKQK